MQLHGAVLEIKRVPFEINAYQEKTAGDKEHYLRLKFVTGQIWGLLWAELCTFLYVEVLILRTSHCDCLYLETVPRVGKKLKQNSLFLLSRENPVLPPVCLLYSHTSTSHSHFWHWMCEDFPTKQFSETCWLSHHLTQLWVYLPGDGVRSHRLRAKLHEIGPLLQIPTASTRSPGYQQLLSNLAINQRFLWPPPWV